MLPFTCWCLLLIFVGIAIIFIAMFVLLLVMVLLLCFWFFHQVLLVLALHSNNIDNLLWYTSKRLQCRYSGSILHLRCFHYFLIWCDDYDYLKVSKMLLNLWKFYKKRTTTKKVGSQTWLICLVNLFSIKNAH